MPGIQKVYILIWYDIRSLSSWVLGEFVVRHRAHEKMIKDIEAAGPEAAHRRYEIKKVWRPF